MSWEGLTNCFFKGNGVKKILLRPFNPILTNYFFKKVWRAKQRCASCGYNRQFCSKGVCAKQCRVSCDGLATSFFAESGRSFSKLGESFGRLLVVSLFAVFAVSVFSTQSFAAPDKMASKTAAAKAAPAGAVGAKKKVAAKPAAPQKKAPPKPTKPLELTAPAMAGVKDVVSPDSKAIKAPDKGKSIASAKSFSEQLKELEKGKNQPKKKKPVRMRKQVIDGKVCVWGRTAEDAEMYASEAIRKFVGRKANFRVKDSVFVSDSPKFICMVRFNYSDEMPETWFLETEMVTGFGKSKERAYADAICKATTRVKNVQRLADWKSTNSSTKNATEMGMIPYDYLFATIGKETYCKIFFRYLMPR